MFKPEIIKYPSIDEGREKMAISAMESYLKKNVDEGEEIGHGRTAEVKILEEDKTICMKAVFNKEVAKNDCEKEMEFLNELSQKGYSVPKPVCTIKTEGDDYFFMETVATSENPNGLSLADLVDKDKINELPKNFDFKIFFQALHQMVDDLNDKENLYHRDLHLGNIMINSEGLPSIIDFGDAEKVMGNEDPFRRTNVKGEIEIIHRDKDKVIEAYREVGKYLKSYSWFNN